MLLFLVYHHFVVTSKVIWTCLTVTSVFFASQKRGLSNTLNETSRNKSIPSKMSMVVAVSAWSLFCSVLLSPSHALLATRSFIHGGGASTISALHRRQGPLFMSSVESGPYNLGPGSTPLLDTINSPSDMKRFNIKQLKQLSHELRWDVINAVSKTGGHLGSSLGVIELTVALHYLFDAPDDKIVWDVAHQSYPHKILTGRRNQMSTLRQLHGLSGFTNRNESMYDCFGAGHSSTSISAGRYCK